MSLNNAIYKVSLAHMQYIVVADILHLIHLKALTVFLYLNIWCDDKRNTFPYKLYQYVLSNVVTYQV